MEQEALGEESVETVTQEDQLSQPLDNASAPRAEVSTFHANWLAFSGCYTRWYIGNQSVSLGMTRDASCQQHTASVKNTTHIFTGLVPWFIGNFSCC